MPTAQTKHVARVQIDAIADQVKQLHDQDDALSKAKLKTKVEQREVRLKVGALVSVVPDDQLKIIAAKSGYAEARLRNFSFVYGQWPQGSFPADVSYTPLEELARDPERFTKIKAGMSKRDARAAKGGKVDTPSRWSAATKAEFIKEALADPLIARAAAGDVATRAAIAKAENDLYREHRNRSDLDPARKQLRQTVAGDDVIRQIVNARYAVNRALDQAMDDGLTDAKRAEALKALSDLTTAVTWFESYLNNGDTSFEQALADLLNTDQEN